MTLPAKSLRLTLLPPVSEQGEVRRHGPDRDRLDDFDVGGRRGRGGKENPTATAPPATGTDHVEHVRGCP